MENSDDIRLIVKIAQLYYEQDMTQAQIARELGIYRTTISRLLKRGRDQGIVTIAINYDYNENLWLEQQVKQKFGLKDVVVVSGNDEDEDTQLAMMGLHGAQLLDRLLEPGDIVGFSWGRAVSALVENLPQAGQSRQLICVPIIGGPSGKLESRYHVNTLTYSAAAKLKGESHLADFPALLDNPLIRNGIMQSQHFKTISAYWDNLDVALVGIGSPAIRDGANWHAFYGGEESDDLNARQVAGDICSRFFDIHGGDGQYESHKGYQFWPTDISSAKEVNHTVAEIIQRFGRIDGLVNNAGVNFPRLLVDEKAPAGQYELNEAAFEKMVNINQKGVFLMSQAVARQMVKQHDGVIVNVSSESGLEGSEGQSCYAATKAALNSFTRSWSKELGKHGIRVVGIAPGILEKTGLRTPEYEEALAWTRNITVEQLREGYTKNAIPIGRAGRLAEVADFVCYLLSERASYITGVTTNIAGGKTRG